MTPAILTLLTFIRARHLMRRLRTRADLDAFQALQVRRFLRWTVPRVTAFKGARLSRLEDAPLMDKAALMTDFERYNRLGLTAQEGWDIFEGRAAAPAGHAVGASTGTSGNRGLYVVSARERYRWLGVLLSRALPDILTRSERVAVILPQASRLYDAANESRRVHLEFFDLAAGIDQLVRPVAGFKPSVIVAPPRVLRAMAEADVPFSSVRAFAGGEVLDEIDARVIEARFASPVRQIYMATEGLFAVSCQAGGLHLIEDHVAFETLPVAGSDDHFNPVITDFSRGSQIMLRFRMNDVVTFGREMCPCGSPHRTLASIAGRLDDAFRLRTNRSGAVLVTPDVIRNAVVGSHRAIDDFKVVQVAADRVILRLKPEHEALLAGALAALGSLFRSAGADVTVEGEAGLGPEAGARKLRRVEVALDRTGA